MFRNLKSKGLKNTAYRKDIYDVFSCFKYCLPIYYFDLRILSIFLNVNKFGNFSCKLECEFNK